MIPDVGRALDAAPGRRVRPRRRAAAAWHPPGSAPSCPVVRCSPGRALPARHSGSVDVFLEAFTAAQPGDVLVVDNGGRVDEACVGDLTVLEAQVGRRARPRRLGAPSRHRGARRDRRPRLQLRQPAARAASRRRPRSRGPGVRALRAAPGHRGRRRAGGRRRRPVRPRGTAGRRAPRSAGHLGNGTGAGPADRRGPVPCATRPRSRSTWRAGGTTPGTPSTSTCAGWAAPSRSD